MNKITIQNKAILNAEGEFNSNHCKPVVCIKVDGSEFRIFSSRADAAKSLGINANYISSCMSDNVPCKGWRICDAREVATLIGEMGDIINGTARDAQKWREQEAEKERIRIAKEKYASDLAKAEKRVERRRNILERSKEQTALAEKRLIEAEMELEALRDMNQQEVA